MILFGKKKKEIWIGITLVICSLFTFCSSVICDMHFNGIVNMELSEWITFSLRSFRKILCFILIPFSCTLSYQKLFIKIIFFPCNLLLVILSWINNNVYRILFGIVLNCAHSIWMCVLYALVSYSDIWYCLRWHHSVKIPSHLSWSSFTYYYI